jgi:hypothetical protein
MSARMSTEQLHSIATDVRELGDEMSRRLAVRRNGGEDHVRRSSSDNADDVIFSEPMETPLPGGSMLTRAADGAAYDADDPWNAWVKAHLAVERAFMSEVIAETLALLRAELGERVHVPLQKAIRELELKHAQLNGMFDVLRGLGPPLGITPRGTYQVGVKYNKFDLVCLNHSSFIAKQDDPGACPDSGNWQLLCSGRRGPRGQDGLQGEQGEPGEMRVPTISNWHIRRHSPRRRFSMAASSARRSNCENYFRHSSTKSRGNKMRRIATAMSMMIIATRLTTSTASKALAAARSIPSRSPTLRQRRHRRLRRRLGSGAFASRAGLYQPRIPEDRKERGASFSGIVGDKAAIMALP